MPRIRLFRSVLFLCLACQNFAAALPPQLTTTAPLSCTPLVSGTCDLTANMSLALTGSVLVDAYTATLPTWTTGSNACAGGGGGPCGNPPYPTAPGAGNNVPVFGVYDSNQAETVGGAKRLMSINYNATTGQASLNGAANNYESQTLWYGGNGSDVHHLPSTSGCCEGADHYFGGGSGHVGTIGTDGGNNAGQPGGRVCIHGGRGGNSSVGYGSVDIDSGNRASTDGSYGPADITGAGGQVFDTVNVGIVSATGVLIGAGSPTTTNIVTRSSAFIMHTDANGDFSMVDSNANTRLNMSVDATITGSDRVTNESIDATTVSCLGKTCCQSGSPGFSVKAGGVASTFEAGAQGIVSTLSDYENVPAWKITSNTTVANNKDYVTVDNNGTPIMKLRTNAGGGDTMDVYGAQASDIGPLVVIGVGASNVGSAITQDAETNVGGHKWSWEALGSYWTSVSGYWTNGFRVVDATLGKVRMTIGGSTYAGGANDGGEVSIGASAPVSGGALLQVQGAIASTTSGAGGVKYVCWKSDGITLGYGTAAEVNGGTCH